MANLSKIIQLVTEHLQNGEEILRDDNKPIIIEGQYETKILNNDSIRTGFLIATNQRIIFYAKKLTGYEIESFLYQTISSFEGGKNLMGNHIKIVTSGNTAYIKWIQNKAGFQILLDAVHNEMHNSKTSIPVTSNSVADEILKLSSLFENKLISAEEFQTLKQKIIGKQ